MKVYVYYDADSNITKVFSTIDKAKAFGESHFPDEEDWQESTNGDLNKEYQHIWIRDIE